MKKLTLLLIIICVLTAQQTMSSKKRGKLSKREYAAKKAGGTLNYSKNTITVKKSTPKQTVKQKNDARGVSPMPQGWGDQNSTYWSDPNVRSKAINDVNTGSYTYEVDVDSAKKSRSKPREAKYSVNDSEYMSKNTSPAFPNREQAAPVYNGGKGVLGASDSTNRPSTISAPTGKEHGQWYTSILEEARGLIDKGGYNPYKGIKNLAEDVYTGFQNQGGILGAPKANAMDEKYFDDNLGLGENPYTPPSAMEELGFIFDNGEVTGYNPTNQQTYSQPEKVNQSRPNPKPTQNIFTQYQPFTQPNVQEDRPEVRQDYTPQPDYTPIVNNAGTTRRPFGNGSPMSNGAFSNGKGYTGFEGATLGMNGDVDNETNLINQLLGIKTAQASDMPQTMNTFQSLYNKNPLLQSNQASQRVNDPSYMAEYTSPAFRPDTTPKQTGGGYTGGSQGQGGGMAPQGIDEKALAKQYGLSGYKDQYRAQEKANKQAQRDLAAALQNTIAQINSQYAESQTEGQGTLDKAKQEDLLKLSGLFNFANQDPNSEQRMQYQQRTNDDYAGQLTDLINKLTRGKEQDVLGAQANYNTNSANYRQQGQDALNQIQSAKSAAKQNLAQLIYQMQQDQMNRQAKSGGGSAPKQTKPVKLGVDQNGKAIYGDPYTLQQVNPGYDIYNSVDPMTALLQGLGGGGRQIQYDENGRAYYEE